MLKSINLTKISYINAKKKKNLKKWMFQDKPIIKTIVEANNIHYIQTSCKTIDKQDIIII